MDTDEAPKETFPPHQAVVFQPRKISFLWEICALMLESRWKRSPPTRRPVMLCKPKWSLPTKKQQFYLLQCSQPSWVHCLGCLWPCLGVGYCSCPSHPPFCFFVLCFLRSPLSSSLLSHLWLSLSCCCIVVLSVFCRLSFLLIFGLLLFLPTSHCDFLFCFGGSISVVAMYLVDFYLLLF